MEDAKFERFFARYWVIWSIYFILPQFIADSIHQKNGYLYSYTGYYWLLHVFLLLAGILIWKFYESGLVKFASVVLFVLEGYMYFRYLQPELIYFNPYLFALNMIILVPMVVQLLWLFFSFMSRVFVTDRSRTFHGPQKAISTIVRKFNSSKGIQIIVVVFLVVGVLLPIANRGFWATTTIADEGNEIKRVGFWNYGHQGPNATFYNNTEAKEELAQLRDMNAFIMLQTHANYLERPELYNRTTGLMQLYESYDIEVVLNANPVSLVLNETSGNYYTAGDYVTYYHTDEINHTVNLILDWIAEEGFTNVIGLSLDIEGPIYENASHEVSRKKYEEALYSYSEILKKFKEAHPDTETMQISMGGQVWDAIDPDYDLSVARRTVDNELNFDKYGYMHYELSNIPRKSSYDYYTYMVQAKKIHGEKFQPWVGWIGNNETMDDDLFYERVVEQLKIAKNFAGEEIIIGYLPMFTSDNHQVAMERLQMLEEIAYSTYEPFEIEISHKKWTETIFPTYWMMNHNILMDIFYGHRTPNGNVNPWFNVVATVSFLAPLLWFNKDSLLKKNRKEISSTNPSDNRAI